MTFDFMYTALMIYLKDKIILVFFKKIQMLLINLETKVSQFVMMFCFTFAISILPLVIVPAS